MHFAKEKIPNYDYGVIWWVELRREKRFLEECCRVLRSSGFMFRDDWASVLEGID